MYLNIIFAGIVITVVTSFIYLYIWLKKKERFMMFWGLACAVNILSLIMLLTYFNTESEFFLEIRKLIDMFNMLLLLFGVFAFMHTVIPTYWYRFSLYMLLLSGACILYEVDLFTFYIPISIFQTAITVIIIYNICRYWDGPYPRKFFAVPLFGLWGISKAILSLLVIGNLNFTFTYEITLSIILNLGILTIYIRNMQQESKLADHLYRTLVENTTDVIFYYKFKPFGAFEYVTPSIKDVTGYTADFFYKSPRFYVNLVDQKYLGAIEDIFTGKIQSDEGHIMEFIRKDGTRFWGEIKASIINDEEKKHVAVEGILHDITEMKSSQLEQIKLKKSRDVLLSYISHELRTPVTSISGYLTAMNDGTIKDEEEVKEAMEIIGSTTVLLKKLVDDLDQLSKLETHQFAFDFMTIKVSDLVDSLISEQELQMKSTSLPFDICYNKDTVKNCWIVADQDRIGQVFSNLLSNAIKYSRDESTIKTSLSIDEKKEFFVVDVANAGIDIPPKDLLYIFDKFYRVQSLSPGSSKGRGLGLAIAKEIIQSHKGEIFAEYNDKNDIVFTFKIPLFKEDGNVK